MTHLRPVGEEGPRRIWDADVTVASSAIGPTGVALN